MKKAYLYFLVPLVGLALFGAFYWQFSAKFEQRQEEYVLKERKKKEDAIARDNANRVKAIEEATIAQEKRKKEKAAKEAREAKDKEDRELALAARKKADAEAEKIDRQVTRLTKEVEEAKKEIQKIDEDKARALAEETFLKEYLKKAEANRASLMTVVEKIDAADKAAEALAKEMAAAAQAAKKK